MKTFNYILMLFCLGSCTAAQNFQLINALHTTSHGGVKGARAEKFDIILKDSPKLEVKYLLVGNVQIDLVKEKKSGTLHLKGIYFPEKQATITLNGETTLNKNDFNLKETYLIAQDLKTKKEISQKITFSENDENSEAVPTDDVPE